MKSVLKFLAIIAISLLIGTSSAFLAVDHYYESGWISNGAWRTNLAIGSEEAGMYTRAMISLHALFALNKSEAIYFSAFTDDDGMPLRSSCDYRIEGKDLPARWWSITVYGSDHFLIPNEQNRYSYTMMNVERNADNSWSIYLSPEPKSGNWIPTDNQDQLYITLRLYNPEPVVYEDPAGIELPKIIREGCR